MQEPKKDLIARVVRIIGNKKAIELLMETAEVEQNGGLFIMVRLIASLFLILYYFVSFFNKMHLSLLGLLFINYCSFFRVF